MKKLSRFSPAIALLIAACQSSSTDLGTDVGNAADSSDVFVQEAEEALVGVISENEIGTSDSSTALQSFTALRRPRLFPNSPLRGDCPSSSRSEEDEGQTVIIEREFDSCRPFGLRGGTWDGATTITINRSGSDDLEADVIDRSGTIVRSIEITDRVGRVRTVEENNTFTTEGTYPSSITHTLSLDSSRELKNLKGEVVSHPVSTGTLTYVFSGDEEISTLVLNGEITIVNDTLSAEAVSEVSDLTWDETCCYPISGSLSQTVTRSGTESTREIVYGPTCGNISIDGESFELSGCDSGE